MAKESDTVTEQTLRIIPTEEAFATTLQVAEMKKLVENASGYDADLALWARMIGGGPLTEQLLDLDSDRLAIMDAAGIEAQLLLLTSTGVQMMPRDTAIAVAEDANDQLAAAIARHPGRFFGLATVAPQAPAEAVKELERAVTKLGLKAVVINSHILGEYLDNPKFSEVLEAAEALDVPIYLHPNTPPRGMIGPMLEAGLDGAIFGFGVETGMHALRMITAGVFDRFPKLQVIIGHMGEALPFWLYRLDYMHQAGIRANRYEFLKPLKKEFVSNYLRENFYITNSGVAWEPAIKFTQDVIGKDRVLYAMDYPYQCPPEEVAILDAMDMSPEDKKMFFQTNAERVFKL